MANKDTTDDETLLMKQIDVFYSCYGITKTCANICGILKTEDESLRKEDVVCLSKYRLK